MQCQVCEGASFSSFAEASVMEDDAYIYSEALGKSRVTMEMVFTCKRCGQEYGGKATVLVSVPLTGKQDDAPFSDWALTQCKESFGRGWDFRHGGRKPGRGADAPAKAGWQAADDWAADKKGRPPVRGGWQEAASAYLRTEPAWEYMKELMNQWSLSH